MTNTLSARFALWVNRCLIAAIIALCFCISPMLEWYAGLRSLGPAAATALHVAFYLCVPAIVYALWCMEKLLGNILAGQVFVAPNVRCVRHIRWCCAGVSGICLIADVFYPPLVFVTVIMAFLALVVSVVKNVLAAAVELREENDLTV